MGMAILPRDPAHRVLVERCLHLAHGNGITCPPISLRERQILRLVGQGLTTTAIASLLSLSSATVDSHIRSAAEKLGAANRTEAAVLAADGVPALAIVEVAEDQRRLLELLAAGYSVSQAARECHLSARTAQRRLAGTRRLLGAPTNRAAVVELARLGPPALAAG